MAEASISPKFEQVEKLFEWYLEPLDIIDRLDQTGIFDPVGVQIRRVKESDDEGRKQRVFILNEFLRSRRSSDFLHILPSLIDIFTTDENYRFLASLLGDNFSPEFFECLDRVSKVEKVKGIFKLLFPQLQNIEATEVAEHMRSYLPENEREEIEREVSLYGNSKGVFCLLHKLICKRPSWIEHFIKTIRDLRYRASNSEMSSKMSLPDLLEDYCGYFDLTRAMEEQMVFEEDAESPLKSSCIASVTSHSLVPMPGLVLPKPNLETEEAEFQSSSSNPAHESKPVLRGYQKELCKRAVLGDNVIICAPPNSGKTLVAAYIIEQHLQKEGTNAKVLFFTPTGGLAQQQYGKLKEYLVNFKEKIAVIHGGMEDQLDQNHGKTITAHDVIVMTPQILLNYLKNKSVRSLHDFTLMVFDECHHTRASHPYCEIMRIHLGRMDQLVFDADLHGNTLPMLLPRLDDAIAKHRQVIGLTATLGIVSANDEKHATENIYMLLGMMDASGGLSMVTDPENVDEMYGYCPVAPEEHKYIECKDDRFKKSLWEAAADILKLFKTINDILNLLPPANSPVEEMGNGFEQWCLKLRTVAVGHFDDHTDNNDKKTLGRDATSCADTLLGLIKINRMTENCDSIDAMDAFSSFIEKRFTQDMEKNTKVEDNLHEILNTAMQKLQDCVGEVENEMLKVITESIQDKEHKDQDFRCMIMVSRRLYAECLKKFVVRSSLLQHLGCGMYIGTGTKSSNDIRGMTHNKQKDVISTFKRGDCKVLVCTPDAAGEGIDIPKCNLVITIECITNETNLVQLIGRARKDNSDVIHIHLNKQPDQRDMLPYKKLKMMKKVTRQIHKMFLQDPSMYKAQLDAGRGQALSKHDLARKQKSSTRAKYHGVDDSLICRKCSRIVCSLDKIVKVNGSHHTIYVSNFRSMYAARVHDHTGHQLVRTGMMHVNKISCGDCKEDWGNEVAWKGRLVPILTIRGFKIRDMRRKKCHRPSKWRNAGLAIRNLSLSETERFLRQLPETQHEVGSASSESGPN